jgi:hypothetical protein
MWRWLRSESGDGFLMMMGSHGGDGFPTVMGSLR